MVVLCKALGPVFLLKKQNKTEFGLKMSCEERKGSERKLASEAWADSQ